MYIGRFAPSPSGHLHFGSLVTAIGCYLRAKSLNGKFIVRIEDIDTQRCSSDNAQSIITSLQNISLYSDEPIVYQSHRHKIYQKFLNYLIAKDYTYNCQCTRAQLKQRPCPCEHLQLQGNGPYNICFKANLFMSDYFEDKLLGTIKRQNDAQLQHVVLKRKDNIFAYNLCVVCDDILQNITEVVRGFDLLNMTFVHLALYKALNHQAPDFLHLPLAINEQGVKYSKQNHAKAVILEKNSQQVLKEVLCFLDQNILDLDFSQSCDSILKQASLNFKLDKIAHHSKVFIY